MQGENFSSAVHFCKAHTSPNRNGFAATPVAIKVSSPAPLYKTF